MRTVYVRPSWNGGRSTVAEVVLMSLTSAPSKSDITLTLYLSKQVELSVVR